MIDISFFLGVALGAIVTGFCAIGSFNRGLDSVRRQSWTLELAARKRALVSAQVAGRVAATPALKGALRKAS